MYNINFFQIKVLVTNITKIVCCINQTKKSENVISLKLVYLTNECMYANVLGL